MNTVVTKLLDVDRQARQLLDDAKQYYDKTIEEIGREKEDIRARYSERAASHVADVRHAESTQVEDAVSRINADAAAKTKVLEGTYERCHKQWEDELFARCTRLAVKAGDGR